MNHDLQPFIQSIQNISKEFLLSLPYILLALSILVIFFFIGKLSKAFIKKFFRHKHNNLSLVLGRLSQWLLFLLGIFIAMLVVFPSFKAADFIAGLGIGSIAIGFAFKDIFQNLLCGILILLNEPFKLNDQIKINGSEFEGTVVSIETRATFIKTFDGQCVVIPNSKLYTETVLVETKYNIIRTKVEVGVDSAVDADHVIQSLLKAVNIHKAVETKPKATARLSTFGDFSNIFSVCWWININEYSLLDTKSEVLKHIQTTLSNDNIGMPLPTQSIHLIRANES